MQITTTTLTRAAGLAAVAAGALFIAVQVKHPEITLDFVQSTQWKVRQGMKIAMATLALAGIAGMYLRQVRQIGVLGLVGQPLVPGAHLLPLQLDPFLRRRHLGESLPHLLEHLQLLLVAVVESLAGVFQPVECTRGLAPEDTAKSR